MKDEHLHYIDMNQDFPYPPPLRPKPEFTCDTVTHVIASGPGSWLLHVKPLLAHLTRAHWLEVGSHEGRSALWTLDNILPPSILSTVTCVDPWHSWAAKKRFDENVAAYAWENIPDKGEVVVRRGTSSDVLPALPLRHYHGVYVDGSHELDDVRRDIELVLPLLAPPAVVVFDDYDVDVEAEKPLADGVRPAVDEFLAKAGNTVELLWRGRQVIVRIRAITEEK